MDIVLHVTPLGVRPDSSTSPLPPPLPPPLPSPPALLPASSVAVLRRLAGGDERLDVADVAVRRRRFISATRSTAHCRASTSNAGLSPSMCRADELQRHKGEELAPFDGSSPPLSMRLAVCFTSSSVTQMPIIFSARPTSSVSLCRGREGERERVRKSVERESKKRENWREAESSPEEGARAPEDEMERSAGMQRCGTHKIPSHRRRRCRSTRSSRFDAPSACPQGSAPVLLRRPCSVPTVVALRVTSVLRVMLFAVAPNWSTAHRARLPCARAVACAEE